MRYFAVLGTAFIAIVVIYLISRSNSKWRQQGSVEKDSTEWSRSDELPPLYVDLLKRSDDLGLEQLIARSTKAAAAFRETLVVNDQALARLIANASIQFRAQFNREIQASTDESSNTKRYDLLRFQLTSDEMVAAIVGYRSLEKPAELYGAFAGKWYGLWEQLEVNHHWGKYVELPKPKLFSGEGVSDVQLLGYQYAWVGDGYGINHVVSTTLSKETFLLGYVIHLADQDLEKETARRPHVGVIDGPKRLIWITKGEVFFEELIQGTDNQPDRYVITGFRYRLHSDANQNPETAEQEVTLFGNEAFQAVYSRSPAQRLPWQGFKIDLQVNLSAE